MAAALVGASVAWGLAPRESPTAFEALPPTSELAGAADVEPPAPALHGAERPRVRVRDASVAAANRAARDGAAPVRLAIPRLGLSLPVRPGGVDRAGLMALPETAYALHWYRFGPGPLDPAGATVIAGHVDTPTEGTGPLARLASARRGDRLTVLTGRGPVGYRVVTVERVAKSVLDLPALFAREGARRLHLVTCGGAYLADRGGYQDNVVLTATPVDPPPRSG